MSMPQGLVVASALSLLLVYACTWLLDYGNEFRSTQSKSRTTTSTLRPPNPEEPQPASASVLHVYSQAAICSDSDVCSEIGKQLLQHGGSAVDAVIATLLCNGLVAMQSMSLGGGMLMNVYSKEEKRAYSILARELAPRAAHEKMFADFSNTSQIFQSSLSIAVPGEVMGYAVAHERFGKLSWSELVQPSIRICEHGYTLSKHQRDALYTNKQMVSQDKHLRKMFIDADTKDFKRVGAHIQPPIELCHSYTSLAEHGPRSFYSGALAKRIVADLKDMGSIISEQDLTDFQVKIIPSVIYPAGDYLLHLMPPPGSGYIIGLAFSILNRFRSHFLRTKEISVFEMHRIVEALKFGFVKRWELDTESDRELFFNLTCPDYAATLANMINDSHTFSNITHYGAHKSLLSRSEHGTAHISVLAPNGDAVSVTSSINFYFGSGRTGTRTGILFNNAMSDFSIINQQNYFDLPNLPGKNSIKPGSSPMSSMAPLIVTNAIDGSVRLVAGAAGGTKIISVLTQLLVRTLWLGENIKQAIDAARFHHQLLPDVLEYEYGVLQSVIDGLEARGHKTERYRVRGSAVCGIEASGQIISANADYRKDGGVAGY